MSVRSLWKVFRLIWTLINIIFIQIYIDNIFNKIVYKMYFVRELNQRTSPLEVQSL